MKGWKKHNKRELAEKIRSLRAEGLMIKEVCAALGISKSTISRYTQLFDIKRGKKLPKCPNCGVAITKESLSNSHAGEMRPQKT